MLETVVTAADMQDFLDAPSTNFGYRIEPANNGTKGLGWARHA